MNTIIVDDKTTWDDRVTPKPTVRIERWSRDVDTWYGDEFLVGWVLDHPNFLPGTFIRSTKIIRDLPDGRVETGNTIYVLA